jgi:MFS family permease
VLVSVAVNAAGLVMMGLATDPVTLTVGRIVSGLAIGSASPAIRRIIVVADPANIGQNLGRLLSADVFGFAMGPALSAVLVARYGLAAPFLVIAVVSVVAVAATLPVSVAEVGEAPRQRLALDLLANRSFAGAVVLGATVYLMIGAFDALWDVVHVDLGTASWLSDLGITLFAVPLVILGPTGGRLAQSLGPFPMAGGGLLVAAFFMASYGFLPSGGWIFGLAMVHAVTDGLTIAASGVAVGLTAPAHRQAGGQGVLGAAQALVAGVMALVTGWLYQGQGRATAYGAAAAAMVVLVVVGLALAGEAGRRRAVTGADAGQ